MRNIAAGAALVLMATGLASAANDGPAWACTLTAKGAAVVHRQGADLLLPTAVDDCRHARVVQGTAIACLVDARGMPNCRSFKAGEDIALKSFGASGTGAGAGTILSALDRLLRGNPGTMPGQSRGAEPLLPSKTVLLLDQALLVDFSEPDLQGVESVEIRRDSISGPLVGSAQRTTGPTPIATGPLADGPPYWAVLVPAALPTQAPRRFHVASHKERQAAKKQLERFDRQRAGPLATAMMRAAWLADNQYDYDALATMKAVGLATR